MPVLSSAITLFQSISTVSPPKHKCSHLTRFYLIIYYVHSGDYHEWIPLHYVAFPGTLNSMQYPVVIPHHAVNGGVSRSDYDAVEGRHRDDQDSSFGEATIPNIRMFHFVLKLVRSMRKHFLPVYATNPEDISNIYVQYENDKRR